VIFGLPPDSLPEKSLRVLGSGFAAAQCGKALPFRNAAFLFIEAMPRKGGIASKFEVPQAGKAEPFRTVRRQSRSPLHFSGKASPSKVLRFRRKRRNVAISNSLDFSKTTLVM